MKSFTLASALAYAGGVAAFWRMPCRSNTGYARIDPIVDPGNISGHVHAITGSSGFSPSANFADLTAEGTCTACSVTQDHSAYWTPALYFQYANGTTVLVEQVGGMLAYYLYYLDNVKAFPEGFVMLAGNVDQRNFTGPQPDEPLSFWPTYPSNQFWLEQRAIGFNCLNYAKNEPEPSLYRHQFPSRAMLDNECTDGIRLELAFPSCGKAGVLDSEDHKSHVAYPSLVKEGNCPDGYDVHYPFLFYETIWNTYQFAGVDGHFMLSNGDPTGNSYHGDFIMGWESADFLQSALDTCKNPSGEISDCALFTIQDDDVSAQCAFDMPEEVMHDNCHGPREGLPVDVPVQWGPEPASKYQVAGQKGAPTTSIKPSSAPATYHQSAVGYSAANPAVTSTAQGGIVVAAEETKSSESPAAAVTPAPSYSSSEQEAKILSTTYITKGYEVIELIVEETEVTVTAPAPSPDAYKHKRHLEKHQHRHGLH